MNRLITSGGGWVSEPRNWRNSLGTSAFGSKVVSCCDSAWSQNSVHFRDFNL